MAQSADLAQGLMLVHEILYNNIRLKGLNDIRVINTRTCIQQFLLKV